MTAMKLPGREPPRYQIEEAGGQGPAKLLPVEQRRILEKLMKAGAHALEPDERDLMQRLLEKLTEDGNRMRALRTVTGSGKPLDTALRRANVVGRRVPTAAKEADQGPAGAVDDDGREEPVVTTQAENRVVGFKPEEVVKRYIECWNRQMFGAEYECFSRSFLSMPQDDYVSRRQQMFRQELTHGGQDQQFGEFLDVNSTGYEAEVICTKQVRSGNGTPKEERELYRLRIEDGHWVIYYVKPVE